jgi:uncharacterized protein (DUF2062 family)
MKVMVLGWAKRKFILPLIRLIKQGISVERLAVSLALGITIGLMPLYGLTTFLVGLVALSLRLNFIAMQIAHYIVTPFQLVLIVPFFKLGIIMIKASQVSFSIHQYIQLLRNDFWHALREFWLINLSAVGIWLIVAIPLFLGLYFGLFFTLRRYKLRLKYLHV